MNLSLYTKPGSIFLVFNQSNANIYRKSENDTDYTLIAESISNRYEDTAVDFGICYRYKIVAGLQTVYSEYVWSMDRFGTYGAVQSVYRSASKSIVMARLLNTSTNQPLPAESIKEVQVDIYRYEHSDLVDPEQYKLLQSLIIQKAEIITSNIALTPEWTVDDEGYNLIYQLPEYYAFKILARLLIKLHNGRDFELKFLV